MFDFDQITLDQTFVVVDGLSGIGKDTVLRYLGYRLCDYKVVSEKEPTDKMYGERALVRLRHGLNDLETTMLLLLDRYEHMKTLSEKCAPNSIILMNRYGLSSLIYQNEAHEKLISEAHRFFPTPDITFILDAPYSIWLDSNKGEFVSSTEGSDRGNFRSTLRNKQIYDSYRKMYTNMNSKHITGNTHIITAFRDLEDMADEMAGIIISKIGQTSTEVPIETLLLHEALKIEETSLKGKDSGRNKALMVEIEKCIHQLLIKKPDFGVDDIYIEMNNKNINKVIGNVIQRLLAKKAIEPSGKVRKNLTNEALTKSVLIYQRGDNFRSWEVGV